MISWVRLLGLGAVLAIAPACGSSAQGKVPVDSPIYVYQPPEEEEPEEEEEEEPEEPDEDAEEEEDE